MLGKSRQIEAIGSGTQAGETRRVGMNTCGLGSGIALRARDTTVAGWRCFWNRNGADRFLARATRPPWPHPALRPRCLLLAKDTPVKSAPRSIPHMRGAQPVAVFGGIGTRRSR